MAKGLNDSFANITGIDVSATLTKIGTGVASKATALVTSFENITGIDVSATLTGIKNGVANTAKKLVSSFENITGLKIPSFDEVVTSVENITGLKVEDFSAKWKQVTASIPQWIKDNIFDPGAAGRGGSGAGSPMKIFGMELKFPSLNISFSGMADKLLSILPKWLTDPAGYIGELIDGWLETVSYTHLTLLTICSV